MSWAKHSLAALFVVSACGDDGGLADAGDADAGRDGASDSATMDSRIVTDSTPPEDSSATPDAGAGIYRPAPGTSWQWQLSGTIDATFDVAMYDIDLFDAPQTTIDSLHADGRIVICYFSGGSYEEWRDDATDFPASVLGDPLDGWPGERWLDVRAPEVRAIMTARLDVAVAKGCDGVEPDNVDGYQNASGFPLTAADQLDFNRFLATEAHARALSVGLKNDLDQIPDLVDAFDWALNEECFAFDECDTLTPFIDAGKAVFHVEYGGAGIAPSVCAVTQPLGLDTLIKNLDLDAFRVTCP